MSGSTGAASSLLSRGCITRAPPRSAVFCPALLLAVLLALLVAPLAASAREQSAGFRTQHLARYASQYRQNTAERIRISPRPVEPRDVQRYNAARDLLRKLSLRIKQGPKQLQPRDKKLLDKIQKRLGRASMRVPDPDHPGQEKEISTALSYEALKEQPDALGMLKTATKLLVKATEEQPAAVLKLGKDQVPIHNQWIAERMQRRYTLKTFRSLFALAKGKGVFKLKIDENGLVRTADVTEEENAEMTRQWVTDTVRSGELERIKQPKAYRKALNTLAAFYDTPDERAAFEKAIADPESYRQGGPLEGVAHIFMPKTLKRDPNWFNNKRLESHGLALQAFSEAIVQGIGEGKAWGYSSPEKVSPQVLGAITHLAKYFKAIDYSTAPSAGNWEEVPFKGGLTSDTEAVRRGFESLNKLMFHPTYNKNPAMQAIRAKLAAKGGSLFTDKLALQKQIARGRARVKQTYLAENPQREVDSSLVFVTTSSIRLDSNPVADVKKHVEVLKLLERKLVRKNGIIRYAGDSYIGLNYDAKALDKDGKINDKYGQLLAAFGSKDASDPAVFAARQALSVPHKEAEWFMVSEMARGYGNQVGKLLGWLQKAGRRPTRGEAKLLQSLLGKEMEYVNRGYARITGPQPNGKPSTKANGKASPSWAAAEAYQKVSTLRTDGEGGQISADMPGENIPLAWATSSLYKASAQLEKNLVKMEQLGL